MHDHAKCRVSARRPAHYSGSRTAATHATGARHGRTGRSGLHLTNTLLLSSTLKHLRAANYDALALELLIGRVAERNEDCWSSEPVIRCVMITGAEKRSLSRCAHQDAIRNLIRSDYWRGPTPSFPPSRPCRASDSRSSLSRNTDVRLRAGSINGGPCYTPRDSGRDARSNK